MTQLTAKELNCVTDVLTKEALACKKARVYSKTLTDPNLASMMEMVAKEHEERYKTLLKMIGG